MKKTKLMNWAGCAIVASGFMLTSASHAALYFWDNGSSDGLFSTAANWNPDGNPGASDLAVANDNSLAAITINGNWTVDSLRTSDGGSVVQNSGTLSIAAGGDQGLWVGEFGNNICNYTLNGGTIILNDNQNSFDIGRNNGAYAVFTMNGGSVTNYGTGDAFFVGRFGGSYGRVTMTGGVLNGPNADTHIGLDGAAEWYQSGGTFNCAGLQIGRFASPFATVELSGTAKWNAGLVLLADGHGAFNPRNPGPVDLKLIGSNVVYNSTGLVAMKEANITFDGTGGGLSTMHLGGGILLLDDAEIFFANLPIPAATNQTIVLIDQIGSYPGPDTQFFNAADGTIYDAGSIDWQLRYLGSPATNIVLVSVPDCVAPSISIQPQSQQVVLGNSVTFSVGAGGTAIEYQWQTNNVDIAGATSSSYTIGSLAYADALTYRVKVSNVCSGQTLISSNAVLTVLDPWTFCTWDAGGGNNLASTINNWNPDKTPSVQDFCGDFVTNLLVIKTNLSVDTFRTGNGATVLHTNGTLTITHGIWTDNGAWIPEFGTSNTYILNGGKIVILDPADGFMVARGGGSQGLFNFISGSITNTVGDTHIGLDGVATWTQSGGNLRSAAVQIGRFANNAPVLTELSGNAVWDVGLVLLADGHSAFSPRNTNDVFLTLKGPNVSYKSTGMILYNEGKVTFDGTGGGISTMDFGGGQFLLSYGQLYLTNLPTVQSNGQQIVLMKNIGNYTGANTQFTNAPDGTIYGGWQLKYQGTNISLVALPVIKITNTSVSGGNVTMVFSAGTSDTTGSFTVQGASVVSGPYADVSPAATITNPSSGVFQAVTPISGPIHFYRIRR